MCMVEAESINAIITKVEMAKNSKCWKYYQEDLEKLFGVGRRTLKKWEKEEIFRRDNLRSVIDLFIRLNITRTDVMSRLWKDMRDE